MICKTLSDKLCVYVYQSSSIIINQPFKFTGRTDEEKSLVCPIDNVPESTLARDDDWRAFRICGQLDFSLIGILSRISKILAENTIGIFAISQRLIMNYISRSPDDEDIRSRKRRERQLARIMSRKERERGWIRSQK